MKKLNLYMAAIAALGLVSLTATAETAGGTKCEPGVHRQHGPDAGGPLHHRFMNKQYLLFAKLDLTEEQKRTLAAARAEQEPAMRDLHEKMRAAHDVLDKASEANADDASINKLSNDLAVLIAQQEVARIKAHKQLLNILTPEQKQKLESFKAWSKDGSRWKNPRGEDSHRNEKRQEKSS